MRNKVIYSLSEEDIQTVALQEIERNLSSNEIKEVKELIAEKIKWYDIIAEAIDEKINMLSNE